MASSKRYVPGMVKLLNTLFFCGFMSFDADSSLFVKKKNPHSEVQ